ncbi:uncharacterized protein V6R79_020969 [Siganus canaliculatus]
MTRRRGDEETRREETRRRGGRRRGDEEGGDEEGGDEEAKRPDVPRLVSELEENRSRSLARRPLKPTASNQSRPPEEDRGNPPPGRPITAKQHSAANQHLPNHSSV